MLSDTIGEKIEKELSQQFFKVEVRQNRNLNVLHIVNKDCKTTLFFIHGMGGRIGHWRHQIKHLSPMYNIVAWDNFGFGQSDKNFEDGGQYKSEEYMKDLDIIFSMHKTNKNVLIGHSMGSCFAMRKCISTPGDVHQLIVIGSCSTTPPSSSSMIWVAPTFLLDFLRPMMSSTFIKMAYHRETSRELVEYENGISKKNDIWITKQVVTQLSWPEESDISKIQIPVLNLIGETDGVMSLESAQNLTKLLKNCKEIIVQESSHNLMWEKPIEINNVIQDFLEQ